MLTFLFSISLVNYLDIDIGDVTQLNSMEFFACSGYMGVIETSIGGDPCCDDDSAAPIGPISKAYAGVEFTHAGKEPLKNKWAFWHLEGNSEKSWEDCLRKLCVVDNIEDFWSAYGKYLPASELTMGSDYYLFKDGVKPMWEDPMNIKGGRWVVSLGKQIHGKQLDDMWLTLMLAVVWEQFENNNHNICGCAVNIRPRGDKITLWTADAQNDESIRKIGLILQNKLNMRNKIIRYELHFDAQARLTHLLAEKELAEKVVEEGPVEKAVESTDGKESPVENADKEEQ